MTDKSNEWLWKAVFMFALHIYFNEHIVFIDSEDELTILPRLVLTVTGTYCADSCYFCEVNHEKEQKL